MLALARRASLFTLGEDEQVSSLPDTHRMRGSEYVLAAVGAREPADDGLHEDWYKMRSTLAPVKSVRLLIH